MFAKSFSVSIVASTLSACHGSREPQGAPATEPKRDDSCVVSGRLSYSAKERVPLREEPAGAPYAEIQPWAYDRAGAELRFSDAGGGFVFATLSLFDARLRAWLPAECVPFRSRRGIAYAEWLTITPLADGTYVGRTGSELRARFGSRLVELERPLEVSVACDDISLDSVGVEYPGAPAEERLILEYTGALHASPGGPALAAIRIAESDRIPIWIAERQGHHVRAVLFVSGLVLRGWLDGRALRLGDAGEHVETGDIGTLSGETGDARSCAAEIPIVFDKDAGLVHIGRTKACTSFTILGESANHARIGLAGITASRLFVSKAELEASCSSDRFRASCPAKPAGSHRIDR
jgi:hypothetical protein